MSNLNVILISLMLLGVVGIIVSLYMGKAVGEVEEIIVSKLSSDYALPDSNLEKIEPVMEQVEYIYYDYELDKFWITEFTLSNKQVNEYMLISLGRIIKC